MENPFSATLRRFAELTDEEVAVLDHATRHPATFLARRDLIREGDEPGPVLVLLKGWAFRYKILPNGQRQIMAFLMPGDACDLHIDLLAEMDHGIQTATEAQVATVPRVVMNQLLKHPGIARAMYISQLVDEGTLRAWIVSMGRRTSTERLSHLMLELHIRAVNFGIAQRQTMDLPLSQTLLSDALGMTSVHINRVLQALRRSKAVALSRGVLHIIDPAALTRIAGFDDYYLHGRMRIQ